MAPRQSRKHSGSITVGLADMGRTLPHLCPTPLPSQSLASRMASRPSPPSAYQEQPVCEAPKFVPRENVRILPHPPRNREESTTLETPDLGPRLSGETLAELWDAPIEETLPDSKLAKEIIASRNSPVFSPKMGHVRILARPHSTTDSTSHSPPASSGPRSPIPEASPKESSAPSQAPEPSAAPETTASSDASLRDSAGSRVVSSRKLPVSKLKSDRGQRPSQDLGDEDDKTSSGKPSRRRGKGKGKGGGGGRHYRNYHNHHYGCSIDIGAMLNPHVATSATRPALARLVAAVSEETLPAKRLFICRHTSKELVELCQEAVRELSNAPDLTSLTKTARCIGMLEQRMTRSRIVDPDQIECLQSFVDTIWQPMAEAIKSVQPPLQILARIATYYSDSLQRTAMASIGSAVEHAVNGAWQQKALLARSLRRLDIHDVAVDQRCRVAILSRPSITQRFEVQLILTLIHSSPACLLLNETQLAKVLGRIDTQLLERSSPATLMRALLCFDKEQLLEAMPLHILRTLNAIPLIREAISEDEDPSGRMVINVFSQSGMERRVLAAMYAACAADSSDALATFRRSLESQVDCFPFSVDFVLDWRHEIDTQY
ncbi:hypothetical protein FOL47_004182 [Perkinsus chesapeaki]|uniref:Uncharacterized protein n=1 Tax=Perkinsus chesapeaki TaxID=330153 RepID=A0A7J6N0G4_PERCH|nr:hypothetical protein FOL47_004182 [Perkinsus chesapeaki]